MNEMKTMEREELQACLNNAVEKLSAWKEKGVSLDLTRGKPGKEQLEIAGPMLEAVTGDTCSAADGTDCRNYGNLEGLPETRALFSSVLGIPADNIIIGGNASLNLMFDTVARAMLFGVYGGKEPWGKQGKIRFLCPSPGYDRHFTICQTMGIEMIPVEMTPEGPDMDTVERLVAEDSSIKGIWCVPKFSNPQGYTYSDAVVERMAALECAADDFRIFWDNAYAVHELYDETVPLADIFALAKKYGKEDQIFYFASTSKITYSGAGLALFAASDNNLKQIKPYLSAQTIGPDKINQLRHVRFLKDAEGVQEIMRRHAAIIRPKFEAVICAFRENLTGIAQWTEPRGGYFVDLAVEPGCAKRVYALAAEAGVKLTDVGATYPYGKDPADTHLRIAPTFPSYDELVQAIDILCLCVIQATAEKILEK
ncbi:MAG: aminotransferase class I/II-fold pyridoxal phosphate-dependent enzyme [Clostridiales bacterium]|jgi:aspartate/methionine/tyrosine aminotransferase|nr:aminotransferase class I/II-fold pyridoxal phosphate-dependent enzyme [Clostridiales bacterium]